ncbi:MAG: hypothetical protein HFF07_01675 [Oscillospiraceae bacterium]|jgi:putative phosphotransacetylase|nr:hypothetical protein [Oscillospiraceae bacterium]
MEINEDSRKFRVAVSGRHLHLTREALDILFGKGHTLEPIKPTKGQFLSTTRAAVVGPKHTFERVAIMGPCRNFNQLEISLTDAYTLGIPAVIRMSGDIEDTPGTRIIGTVGSIELNKGVIVAKRHIHLNPILAQTYGVADGDSVMLRVDSPDRSLIFDDTIVKLAKNPDSGSVAHIDTDEGNAAGIQKVSQGYILGKSEGK